MGAGVAVGLTVAVGCGTAVGSTVEFPPQIELQVELQPKQVSSLHPNVVQMSSQVELTQEFVPQNESKVVKKS